MIYGLLLAWLGLVTGFDVATFNLRNLSPLDDPARFTRAAEVIVADLGSPDVLAVQEVMDADGIIDTGNTDGEPVFARLVEAVVGAGGPRYRALQMNPEDGADGGVPGGNIRVGFLVRESPAGMPTTSDIRIVAPPTRIAADDSAFRGTRKPLVIQLAVDGEPVVLINLHLISRIGATDTYDPNADRRFDQSQVVTQHLDSLLAQNAQTGVIVLGDLNAELDDPAVRNLANFGLEPLLSKLSQSERGTYEWQGQPRTYDHIFAAAPWARRLRKVEVGRLNRAISDHAPVLARFANPSAATVASPMACHVGDIADHRHPSGPATFAILWLAWQLLLAPRF